MKKYLKKVEKFSKAFNVNVYNNPKLVSPEVGMLRTSLLNEENEEYLQAVIDKDLVEVADALGDQLYIVLGTILTHGMQHVIEDVFMEIHNSNMSKLDSKGKPIINGKGKLDTTRPIGKILKSDNFFEPNLIKILKEHGCKL